MIEAKRLDIENGLREAPLSVLRKEVKVESVEGDIGTAI